MLSHLLSAKISNERDIVWVRQRGVQITKFLGFDSVAQTQVAAAISEIVRNAHRYATGGTIEFGIRRSDSPALLFKVSDHGKGIQDLPAVLAGTYASKTGMGV